MELDDRPRRELPVPRAPEQDRSRPALQRGLVFCYFLALTVLSQANVAFRGETASPTAFQANLSYHMPPSFDPLLDPAPGYIKQALGYLGVQFLKHGQSPWWNPYVGLGSPLAQDLQSAVFYPPALIANWFHLENTGIDVVALTNVLVAGLGAYWLVRVLGLRIRAALVVGTAFCLSGSFIWFGTLFGDVVAWTPLSLALTVRLLRGADAYPAKSNQPERTGPGWRTDVMLLGLVTAIQLLGGFPEALGLQILLLSVPVGIGVLVSVRDRRQVIRGVVRVAAGFALGFLVTAFFWVPFLTALPAEGVWNPPGSGLGQRLPIWSDLILLMPFGFGHWFNPKALTVQQWYYVGGYVGVVATWLALAGVFGAWRKRTSLVTSLVISAVVAVGWINGLPPFTWIGHLPLLNRVGLGRLAVAPLQLVVALLAGLAVDRLAGWKAWAAATVTCGALVWVLADLSPSELDRRSVEFTVACLALVIIVFPLLGFVDRQRRAALGKRRRLLPATAATLVVGILAVELLTLSNVDWRGLPQRTDVWAAPPWIGYVQHHLGRGRIYVASDRLAPNYSSDFGIADISFEDAVIPRATQNFIQHQIDTGNPDSLAFLGMPVQSTFPGRVPELELAGVTLLALADPGCQPACNSFSLRFLDRAAGVGIFSVPHPQPFLWFPKRVAAGQDVPSNLLQEVSVSPLPPIGPSRKGRATPTTQIVSSDNSQLVVRVHTDRRRLLVVREVTFPGWRATVNGHRTQIDTVDGFFQGVVVPAGTSTLRLSYVPRHLRLAEAVSLLALVCAAAIAASGIFRRNRLRLYARRETLKGLRE